MYRTRAPTAIGRAKTQDEVAPQPEPAEHVDVRNAVASLPGRQKTALVLRYYLDMSVAETAETMRCPESTVKSLTRRALKRLSSSPELEAFQEVRDGI